MKLINILVILITAILLVTSIVSIMFIRDKQEHEAELVRIELLEKKHKIEMNKLSKIRSKTKPCPIPGLETPRSCYIDSDYKCHWNEEAKRCDIK